MAGVVLVSVCRHNRNCACSTRICTIDVRWMWDLLVLDRNKLIGSRRLK